MSYQIRTASENDLLALKEMMKQLSGHEITDEEMGNRLEFVKNSPFDSLYVYEEDGLVYGLLGFRIRENIEEVSKFGEVSVIVVDNQARRKGVGRLLMEYAERIAKDQGCIGTWLVSGFGREEEAHRFYKDLGYEVTGYRFVKRFCLGEG